MFHPAMVILVAGLLFILVFGGLGYIRGQGLSGQLAVEALAITGAFTLASWSLGMAINPLVFLLILYLITMRARLLLDMGNFFLNSGHIGEALSLYRLSLKLYPDTVTRCIAHINIAVAHIRRGAFQEAISLLEDVLTRYRDTLGLKNEAACFFNLGMAYHRLGNKRKAISYFNQAVDSFPDSVYARKAEQVLKKLKKSG